MVLGLLSAALGVAPARAHEAPTTGGRTDPVDRALERYNVPAAFGKLGRGLSNVFAGWMEVPLTIRKRYAKSDAATSAIAGAAIGVVRGFVRTGVGLYETVTFLVPLPEHFAPVLPPLEYFQQGVKREALPLE